MTAIAEPMALRLAEGFEPNGDLVVPVPLHGGRMRSRGYNQSALLGKAFAQAVGLPFDGSAAYQNPETLATSRHFPVHTLRLTP